MKEITLTERELEEIKSNEGFKAKTTACLKEVKHSLADLKDDVSKLNGLDVKVNSLQIHRSIQWALLTAMIFGLFSVAWKIWLR